MLQGFLDTTPEQLQEVVSTNLLGTLLCSRRAMQLLASQPQGGHLFNVDGAGADGAATPCYAAYGATKAGELLHMGTCAVTCDDVRLPWPAACQQKAVLCLHSPAPPKLPVSRLVTRALQEARVGAPCKLPEPVLLMNT